MKKIGNNGFTLVELIATIVLLSIVLSIGAYSVITIINKSKEKDYDLLVKNIKEAVNLYYQECKYGDVENIDCPKLGTNNKYTYVYDKEGNQNDLTLNYLVKYGYLTGNSKNEDNLYTLVNTKSNQNIGECKIRFIVSNGEIMIESITSSHYGCPTTEEYLEA